MTHDKENGPEETSWKLLVAGTSLFVLTFALVVSPGLYVRNSDQSLEEKMSSQPVGSGQTPAPDGCS